LFFKFCAIVIGLLKVTYLLTYVIFRSTTQNGDGRVAMR